MADEFCRACGILKRQMGLWPEPELPRADVKMIEVRLVGVYSVRAGVRQQNLYNFMCAIAPGMLCSHQFPLGNDVMVSEIHLMMH